MGWVTPTRWLRLRQKAKGWLTGWQMHWHWAMGWDCSMARD
jgi:hypothetical protein